MIFLTGTPHQGRTPQFINVLTCVQIWGGETVYSDPSVVAEVATASLDRRQWQLPLPCIRIQT